MRRGQPRTVPMGPATADVPGRAVRVSARVSDDELLGEFDLTQVMALSEAHARPDVVFMPALPEASAMAGTRFAVYLAALPQTLLALKIEGKRPGDATVVRGQARVVSMSGARRAGARVQPVQVAAAGEQRTRRGARGAAGGGAERRAPRTPPEPRCSPGRWPTPTGGCWASRWASTPPARAAGWARTSRQLAVQRPARRPPGLRAPGVRRRRPGAGGPLPVVRRGQRAARPQRAGQRARRRSHGHRPPGHAGGGRGREPGHDRRPGLRRRRGRVARRPAGGWPG